MSYDLDRLGWLHSCAPSESASASNALPAEMGGLPVPEPPIEEWHAQRSADNVIRRVLVDL